MFLLINSLNPLSVLTNHFREISAVDWIRLSSCLSKFILIWCQPSNKQWRSVCWAVKGVCWRFIGTFFSVVTPAATDEVQSVLMWVFLSVEGFLILLLYFYFHPAREEAQRKGSEETGGEVGGQWERRRSCGRLIETQELIHKMPFCAHTHTNTDT